MKLILCVTDKIHNSILIYYVLELNNLLEPIGYVSALRHIQEMSCMYMNLQIISLLVLYNHIQSLKQLLFSLSLWGGRVHNKCGEYMCDIAFECCWACLEYKTWNMTKHPSYWYLLLIMRGYYASKRVLLTPFAFSLWFSLGEKGSGKPTGYFCGVDF